MTSMQSVQLSEVAKIDRSSLSAEKINGGTAYLGLEHIESGGRILGFQKVASGDLKSSKFRFTPNHILYGKLRPYLAKIAMPDFEGICSTDIIPILPGSRVDKKYLLYFLRQESMVEYANSRSSGANLPRLSPSELGKFEIPLPPLEEQERIAAILDAAEALRAKRRESIAQLDTLLQSTFLDLFGDPFTNPKGWDVCALREVMDIEHGYAFKSEYFSDHGRYIVLTPGNFYEKGGYRDQGRKTKYYTSVPPPKFILPSGAILVAMTEQAPGLLGSPLCVPESDRYLHNQRLGRLRLDNGVIDKFIYHLFNTNWVRGELQRSSTGTKVKHTSPSKIGSVVSIVPPLSLQKRFASIVESVELQKLTLEFSLEEIDTLFRSLQQRAFSGEL